MKGTPRHTLAKITLQRAFQASPKKLMLPSIRPMFLRDHEMTENCGSKIHQKAMADNTVGTMKGMSTMARKMALKGSFSFSSKAKYKPMANLATLAKKV